MSKLGLSTGILPNDNNGDNLLTGAVKINSNFNEIYQHFGDGNNLTAIGGTWSTNSVGIYTSKNVGIGTTNPTSKLTVFGDLKVGIDTSRGLILTSSNGTSYRLIVADNGTLTTIVV